MKVNLGVLLALLVLGPWASAGEGAMSSPIGELAALRCLGTAKACEAGPSGQGGCYDPTRSVCQDGMICTAGLSVCKKGPQGRGGCYRAADFRCESGAITKKVARPAAPPQ